MNTFAGESEELDGLADPIIEAIKNGETSNLMSFMLPENSPLKKYISDSQIESLNQQFHAKLSEYGKLVGSHLYHESKIEGVISIRYYILRFERQPGLLKIEAYHPNGKWRIQDIAVDSDLDDYLEEAAKVKMGTLGFKPSAS